jgi:DNA-directed RNA polymerase subunit E'/Rpb7
MNGPYFTTFIKTETCVPPIQLNSNLITNIKQNLIKKYKGKCYGNYGYIMDIYSIDGNIGDGIMRAENNNAAVYYNVQFKTKLCNPISNSVIISRIEDINKHMIFAKSGPIVIIIDGQNINPNKFRYNNMKNAFFPLDNDGKDKNSPLNSGSYIKVKIINKRITDRDSKIMVLGFLEDIPTIDEIKENIKNENSNDDDITNLEIILEKENSEDDNTKEENETESEKVDSISENNTTNDDTESEISDLESIGSIK